MGFWQFEICDFGFSINGQLTKEIDDLKEEMHALKQSLSTASSAKTAAENRAEEVQNRADEVEKELESVKKGEQELISALAQAQAECIEMRTKASVLEEMATLRKNNFEAATTVHVPPPQSDSTTATDMQNPESNQQDEESKVEEIRTRIFAILGKLKGQVDKDGKPLLGVKEADQSIWGWLGTNTNGNEEAKTSPPPEHEGTNVDDLLLHLENWASDQGESWSAELNAQSRKTATDAMRKLKECEKELEELRLESSRFKQQDAERSSATVNAAAKRATEAEEKLNALKKKLETLEQRNKELTWQISMYADTGTQESGSSNSAAPVVGVFKQLMLQCTAPRRQQQQQQQQN